MANIADQRMIERERKIKEITKTIHHNREIIKDKKILKEFQYQVMDHYKIAQRKAMEYIKMAIWKVENRRTR